MSSNPSPFSPLTADGVTIVPKVDNDVLRIAMSGAIEMRDPGVVLNPYWNALDDEVRARSMKSVELDLRNLNFMNSSGILTLVRWITRAKGHGTNGYRIGLRFDRNVTWQRTSIPTLAKLAPDIVTATEING
jgi:hypothetical protein